MKLCTENREEAHDAWVGALVSTGEGNSRGSSGSATSYVDLSATYHSNERGVNKRWETFRLTDVELGTGICASDVQADCLNTEEVLSSGNG